MPLSDTALRDLMEQGHVVIQPQPKDKDIQPCSIDLHLGPTLLVPHLPPVDFRYAHPTGVDHYYTKVAADGYELKPGAFLLGATEEHVSLGKQYCAHFDGRSTLGRLGLIVHVTAGFCDPGFKGNITLEIKNLADHSMVLAEGMGIGQLLVDRVNGFVSRPYGSEGTANKYTAENVGPVPPNLRRTL